VRPSRRKLLLLGVPAALVLAGAVVLSQGQSAASVPQSDRDPRVFAGKFLSTGFGVIIGNATPDDVIALYKSECLAGEAGTALKQDAAASRQLVPAAKRVKIDGVEFGDGLEVATTQNGYAVRLPGSKNIRLRINGEWVTAHDKLTELDIEQTDAGESTGQLALEYVDGKLRVAC
jgi:hypothetical protein